MDAGEEMQQKGGVKERLAGFPLKCCNAVEEEELTQLWGAAGGKADGPAAGAPRRRAKRCTCHTYKDKECVYYCHLDIIWINTPERTVPYGLSNYRGNFRGKRSTGQLCGSTESLDWSLSRCSCLDVHDKQCMLFCKRTQENRCNQGLLKKTAEKEQHRENEHAFIH